MEPSASEKVVLDATMRLIGERGLGNLRMKDVAVAAGITKAQVKQLYESRSALIGVALQRFVDEEVRRCEQALKALDDPDIEDQEIVDMLVRELERTYDRPGGFFAQFEVYVAAARDPSIAEVAARCIRAYEQMARGALIQAGLPEENAASVARWIIALLDGFGLHGVALGEDTYLPPDISSAIRALGAGAFAPPQPDN